jgi:hypothetical protein
MLQMENPFACVTLTASFKSEFALPVTISSDIAIRPGKEETMLLRITKLDGC